MISCKEAAILGGKMEEGKLSIMEWINLMMHMMMCVYCRRFRKQSKLITESAKHMHSHEEFTSEEKGSLKGKLGPAGATS